MKALILFIFVCGQPDSVLIKEVGQDPVFLGYEEIVGNPNNLTTIKELMEKEGSETVGMEYNVGTCS